ncbi:MAG: DUF4397 domain-containing protein [Gammaproteobacteria bacterium]|nr:DUF4397 domain-containing protein [Gammaproteobacteria bacterium]
MLNLLRTARLYGALVLALVTTLFIASCGGGGDIENELAFRVIHASPDSPPVNILVDGVTLRSGVDYKGGTALVFVTPRDYRFGIQALLPGDDALVIDQTVSLAAGSEFTVLAIGKGATGTVQSLIVENPFEDVPDGNARLQFVHAAPDAPAVDVYLTAPGADLLAAVPLDQVTYGSQPAARKLVPTGTYQIRVTPAGDAATVVFDSGPVALLRNRDDLLIVLVQNTAAGASPISLVINDRFSTSELLDMGTKSDLRVVHVSPDAPALDVVGDPSATATPEETFASGLTYLGNTGYVSVPPETYTVRGVKTSEPNPATPLFSFLRLLSAGQRATVFATGRLATINAQVVADDIRSVFTEGRLRLLDAAPASGTVDAYVVAAGTDINTVDPTLRNLVLTSITGYQAFAPGNYTITFTTAGTKTVLASQDVAATAGTVQTVILVDEVRVDETSDGNPPAVLVLDDRAGQAG